MSSTMANTANTHNHDIFSRIADCMERNDWTDMLCMLSGCGQREANNIVTQLIAGNTWDAVKNVVGCVGDNKHTWNIGGVSVKNNTLLLVAEANWQQIGETLNTGAHCCSTLEWILEQACLRSTRDETILYCVPRHDGVESEVDTVRQELMTKAECRQIQKHILPHCTRDHLNSVMVHMVSEGHWKGVGKLLTCVDDMDLTWAVDGLCVKSKLMSLIVDGNWEDILKRELIEIVPLFSFSDDIVRHVSENSTENEEEERSCSWWALGKVLQQGVDDKALTQMVELADEFYDGEMFLRCILPYCTDAHTDLLVKGMVSEGQWKSVAKLLTIVGDAKTSFTVLGTKVGSQMLQNVAEGRWKEVSDTLQEGVHESELKWLVHAVCLQNHDSVLMEYVVPNCKDNQLDTLLVALVEQGRWLAVAKLLTGNVSESTKRWAVQKACEHPETYGYDLDPELYITNDILPHAADDQLDDLLRPLIDRGLHLAVAEVLKRGVSPASKERAVYRACGRLSKYYFTHRSVIPDIIDHVDEEQWSSVLTLLLETEDWCAVGEMMKRGLSDSEREWVLIRACTQRTESEFREFILPHCTEKHMFILMTKLMKVGMWRSVVSVLDRGVSVSEKSWAVQTACAHADENTIIWYFLEEYIYDDTKSTLENLAFRSMWKPFLLLLYRFVIDTLCMWAVVEDDTGEKEQVLWDIVTNPSESVRGLSPDVWRSVTWSDLDYSLKERLEWDTPLCEILCESLLRTVKEIWQTGREKEIVDKPFTVSVEAKLAVESIHAEMKPTVMESNTSSPSNMLLRVCMQNLQRQHEDTGDKHCLSFQLCFMKYLISEYYKRKAWKTMINVITLVLATIPVVPGVQDMALRIMLRLKQWDVISFACMTHVCEQLRRDLFQAAVRQKQWVAVKRWADHTLYDDQRWWALQEAFKEKQWGVFLMLADHGLKEVELMNVHHRLAQFAKWKVVFQMFERGAFVTEIIEVLQNNERRKFSGLFNRQEIVNKTERLQALEKKLIKQINSKCSKRHAKLKWCALLYKIIHCSYQIDFRQAARDVIEDNAWHVMVQLVRLGMDAAQRDALFPEMVRRQQWGVCRALLEQGVSIPLCLDFLPELMKRRQWTLVSRVMECDVEDTLRRQVMVRALDCKEGSLVWKCISTLGYRLSLEEREELFQEAFHREIWQAVKPLVEENNNTGNKHRDTAMLEAIQQHQWDVVDHCQRYHADINMVDDDGQTAMHRAARAQDWEAVKELAERGGDASMLDIEGVSVLHRTIQGRQWDAVKLLIQFHGDIHRSVQPTHSYELFLGEPFLPYELYQEDIDRFPFVSMSADQSDRTITPLQMLIDACQGEIIQSTLMWCPDQWKGVNRRGETALHATCLSGLPDTLYYLIARKVDPLAATRRGHSALCYAVLCKGCPQTMVAECIELGFSTPQPRITDTARRDKIYQELPRTELQELFKSPLVLAVMCGRACLS
ncbi:uncharacterized protein [Littorina saxatilis]|uniref:uncharacterized protein n=1 Tax=Littorina saxatilis TaxID=31220 RepID=UPI0038B63163